MAIQPVDLKVYKSSVVNDSATNGGRISSNQSISGVADNLFPYASNSERISGITRWRKAFYKVASPEDKALLSSKLIMDQYTLGGDAVYFYPGTPVDTKGDLTGSEAKRGAGYLQDSVLAGDTSLTVVVENGGVPIYYDGEEIWISNGGTEELIVLSAPPVVVGDVVTLTLSSAIANPYTGGLNPNLTPITLISSVLPVGDVGPTIGPVNVVSSAGAYDDAIYPLLPNSIGALQQTWTLTFTSSTNFDCIGDSVGSVGSGIISADFIPINVDFSQPFFTMLTAGWSGTFSLGDTVTFTITGATVPYWCEQIIPPNTDSMEDNFFYMRLMGGSA